METTNRQRTIYILFLAACCFAGIVRAYSQRPVTRQQNADRLIESAERWLHVREITGNNDHPWITRSMNLVGLDGDKGYPWCASAQAEIHHHAEIPAPKSARVVDWFKKDPPHPDTPDKRGMVGGLYYKKLKRLGHIFLIVGEDKNNYYTFEGNTNLAGSREGDGFYRKVRPKNSTAALADYCETKSKL